MDGGSSSGRHRPVEGAEAIDVPRTVLTPFLHLLGSGEQSAALSSCPLEMPSPIILRTHMVAMEEILRYWQLLLKTPGEILPTSHISFSGSTQTCTLQLPLR